MFCVCCFLTRFNLYMLGFSSISVLYNVFLIVFFAYFTAACTLNFIYDIFHFKTFYRWHNKQLIFHCHFRCFKKCELSLLEKREVLCNVSRRILLKYQRAPVLMRTTSFHYILALRPLNFNIFIYFSSPVHTHTDIHVLAFAFTHLYIRIYFHMIHFSFI